MKKSLFLFLIINTINSYSQNNVWKKIDTKSTDSLTKMDRASVPSDFILFALDIQNLKNQLQLAPLDLSNIDSNVILSFPNADGSLNAYKIFKAPVLENELSKKFPNINSYSGKGIDDPTATIRFSLTMFGFHAMILSGQRETTYIDTFTKDLNNYIVYYKSSVSRTRDFECKSQNLNTNALDNTTNFVNNQKIGDGKFRQFRLAMACTIEYASFHVNQAGLGSGTLVQKKAAVLAAMGVTMTRVNGIFERDMAMRLTLIGTNDLIIFITSDNFSNDDADLLIDESQAQITSIIGSNNFDIGHTVSTGGGGLASTSPCDNGSKASGITGQSAPVGDPFDIDFVIHEMGHQFGANHTFRNSCGGNVNGPTAVEPGSGSTIMAYAGICAPNVQNNSDSYFHTISLNEMINLVTGLSCPVIITNNNVAPIVNAGLDYTIPKSTPFLLKGTATDANNSGLTYCWEQTNNNTSTQPPLATATVGVSSRSFSPTVLPNRYMPKLATVVAGSLSSTWEVTPSVARTMNYTLTARDNNTNLGGQTGEDTMVVTVDGVSGPFAVTSQNTTGINWLGNSSQTVTWNVAGTTANGVNTAQVTIILSTDNGVTFATSLLANTANDGSEVITVPNNVTSSNCRIMVQSVGNIFYAVNTTRFAIAPNLGTARFGLNNFNLYPNPNNGTFKISFDADADNDIQITINDIRGRKIYTKNYTKTSTFEQHVGMDNLEAGVYLVNIRNGANKVVKKIVVE